MVEIFKYTERVVNMVRPRKLLFMAIGELPIKPYFFETLTVFADGVAPRAKMNQQRSRRFRSVQEAREKYEARLEAEAEWKGLLYSSLRRESILTFVLAMGKEVTSEAKESWDSNAITPGTPFMELLANSLRYWVVQKLNTDPGWKDVRHSPRLRITPG